MPEPFPDLKDLSMERLNLLTPSTREILRKYALEALEEAGTKIKAGQLKRKDLRYYLLDKIPECYEKGIGHSPDARVGSLIPALAEDIEKEIETLVASQIVQWQEFFGKVPSSEDKTKQTGEKDTTAHSQLSSDHSTEKPRTGEQKSMDVFNSHVMRKVKSYLSVSIIARMICCALLFWALSRHPYGYFTLLRLAVCVTAAYTAYLSTTISRTPWAWLFGLIALLFNPLIPVRIDRLTWAYLDVATGVLFLLSLFFVRENLLTRAGDNSLR